MTYREFYNAVLNANISDEMNETAVEFLSKLDSRNEKRKNTVTKDKAEAASRRDMVLEFLRVNEGVFTQSPHAGMKTLPPQQAKVLPLLSRMTFDNMHLFKFNRDQRNEILEMILSYYRLHHSTLGSLRSPDVLKQLFV